MEIVMHKKGKIGAHIPYVRQNVGTERKRIDLENSLKILG